MLTTELCAHLSADFNLQIPDKPACFSCTHAALDQWEDTEKGTILVGSFSKIHPDRFYLLCDAGVPVHDNVVYYSDPSLTLPLFRAVNKLLEPERRLQRRIQRMEQACLGGSLKKLVQAAWLELENPVLIVDSRFRTLAMEPERDIGIDSWDRILRGETPQQHDLKQAESHIKNFSARNITGPQIVPYTEPDGRSVRRFVAAVVSPEDGQNHGGLEVIELNRNFTQEDNILIQRLSELLRYYLIHTPVSEYHSSPEESFLQELLFCEPSQQEIMRKKLRRFPDLERPEIFYLALIPLSHVHKVTCSNQREHLLHEFPGSWLLQTEEAFLLLLTGSEELEVNTRLQRLLQEVGQRMGQTVILSMPFCSLLQLGTVWRFNQEAAVSARELHCGAGCRSAAELYQDVFVRNITNSANMRAFIHPMLYRLQEYDRIHSTSLLHTLGVYLTQETNLHETACQLYIHRNTLVYRLQRIRALLQLDLDDVVVRNILRTGCILLEYYQKDF